MNLSRPVILMALANDMDAHLAKLKEEERRVRGILSEAHDEERIEFLAIGSTSLDDLFDEINRKHGQIAIFHYAGHSDGTGLHLEDVAASKGSVSTLLGQEPNLKLAFLNGCANREQVEILHEKGVKNIIATSVKINDETAMEFACTFYESIVAGKTIQDSFDTAAAFIKDFSPGTDVQKRGGGFEFDEIENTEIPWGLYSSDESDLNSIITFPEQLDETVAPTTALPELTSMSLDETVAPEDANLGSLGVPMESSKGVMLTTHDNRVQNNNGAFIIKGAQVLGRDPGCDIFIFDRTKYVSRKHAKIFSKDGRMWITDLDSSLGTYWNGIRISQMEITENGVLRLANVDFQVEIIT